MATQTSSPKPTDRRTKVQTYVNRQLDQTRRRVRTTDLIARGIAGILMLLIALQTMAMIDAWVWPLGSTGRWICFALLVVGSIAWLGLAVGPLFVRKIHPDYAAKMIEDARPAFKNSLLNYVSLRKNPEQTHAAVMEAVSKQAALDLQTVPAETTVDQTSIIRSGMLLLGVICFAVLYWLISPKDPLQSVSRILLPSIKQAAPSIVQVTEVSPGDKDLFFGDSIDISAVIKGSFNPEDVKLIYSTLDGQVFNQALAMRPTSNRDKRFMVKLPQQDGGIQQSLVYHIVAKDGRSPKYALTVKATPSITVESVRITPPAYTGLPEENITGPQNLAAPEGSQVHLVARANRPIKTAVIELLKKNPNETAAQAFRTVDSITMRVDSEDVKMATGDFLALLNSSRTASRATHYRLTFISQNNDRNLNPNVCQIRVIADLDPELQVLNPTQNQIELPVNETLLIDARASDIDYGISSIELQMDSKGGRVFAPKTLPLKSERGKQRVRGQFLFSPQDAYLQPGETAVFTLTAKDNRVSHLSGMLDPNTAQSRQYRIEITPAVANPKQPPNPQNSDQPQENERQSPTAQEEASEREPSRETENENAPEDNATDSQSENQSGDSGQSDNQEQQDDQEQSQPQENPQDGAGDMSQGQDGDSSDSTQQQGANGGSETNDTGGDPNDAQSGTGGNPASDQQQPPSQSDSPSTDSQGGNQSGGDDTPGARGSDSPPPSDASPTNANGDDAQSDPSQQPPLSRNATDGEIMERLAQRLEQQSPSEQPNSSNSADAATDNSESAQENTGRGADPQSNNPRQDKGTGSQQNGDDQAAQSGNEKNNAQRGDGNSSSSQGQQDGNAKGGSGSKTGDQSTEGASSDDSQTGQSDTTGGNEAGDSPTGSEQQRNSQENENGTPGQSSAGDAQPSQTAGSNGGDQQPGDAPSQPSDDGSEQGQANGQATDSSDPTGTQNQSQETGQPNSQGDAEGASNGEGEGEGMANQATESNGPEQSQTRDGQPSQGQSGQSSSAGTRNEQEQGGAAGGNGRTSDIIAEKENLAHSKKATELLLNRLEEQRYDPDPDLLKDLNWSKEDLNQFVDRWQKMQQKAEAGNDPIAQRRYDQAIKSLGLTPDSQNRRVVRKKDNKNGFNTDSAVTRPPPQIAPAFKTYLRDRNRADR